VLDVLHARFLSEVLPRVRRHALVYFRRLRCPHRLADAVAEVIAVCWKWFLKLCQRGQDVSGFVSALAAYAARHVGSGRRLCGQERSKDAMSPLTQQKRGFLVQAFPAHDSGVEENPALDALRDNTKTPPDEQAAFRCDFPVWLTQLGERNGRIARDMAAAFFSVTSYGAIKVIDASPYAVVRHPGYVAGTLVCVGVAVTGRRLVRSFAWAPPCAWLGRTGPEGQIGRDGVAELVPGLNVQMDHADSGPACHAEFRVGCDQIADPDVRRRRVRKLDQAVVLNLDRDGPPKPVAGLDHDAVDARLEVELVGVTGPDSVGTRGPRLHGRGRYCCPSACRCA
jgi:hypothetical protein